VMWMMLIWECCLTIPDNFDDCLAGNSPVLKSPGRAQQRLKTGYFL
jgi:hypothetical protein